MGGCATNRNVAGGWRAGALTAGNASGDVRTGGIPANGEVVESERIGNLRYLVGARGANLRRSQISCATAYARPPKLQSLSRWPLC